MVAICTTYRVPSLRALAFEAGGEIATQMLLDTPGYTGFTLAQSWTNSEQYQICLHWVDPLDAQSFVSSSLSGEVCSLFDDYEQVPSSEQKWRQVVCGGHEDVRPSWSARSGGIGHGDKAGHRSHPFDTQPRPDL